MTRPGLPLLLLLLGGSLSSASADEIYRWTDANGLIHFSSQPPSRGDYKRVTPAPPPSTAAPGVEALRKRAQGIDTERADVGKARQDALRAKADDAEKCAKARERLSFLDTYRANRLYTVGADGAENRMTQEQHEAEVAKAKDIASNSCN